jgi:hypothetical protein
MSRELVAHNRPVFDQLHPNIYRAAVGLVAWFALAAWVLFDRRNDIELPLAMVSVLLWLPSCFRGRCRWFGNDTGCLMSGNRIGSRFVIGGLAISRFGAASSAARMLPSTCCCRWRRSHSALQG